MAIVSPLVTIPVALEALGATAYGAWSAALALVGFATFADLGLGAGVMTRLAEELAEGSRGPARAIVSSAYAALCGMIVAVLTLMWASSAWLDYGRLVGGGGVPGVSMIVLVTLTVFLLNIPASLIVRIQYGAQQVATSNLWQAGGAIAGIVATVAAAHAHLGSAWFIALASGAPVVCALLNSIVFFTRGAGRHFSPRPSAARVDVAVSLLRLGGKFLLINVLIAATTTTDSFIVSHTAGLDAVPEYAIPARVFTIMAVATAVLSGPLWPLNVEALQRGDHEWVRRTTARVAFLTSTTAAVLAVLGVVAGPSVIALWLSDEITPSRPLFAGLGLALFAQAVASPFFMAQNAAKVLLPQIAGYSLMLLTLPAKWAISQLVGFEFIPYVTAIGYVLLLWPAVYWGYRKALGAHGPLASRHTLARR